MGGVVFNLVAGHILDSGLGYGVVFTIVGTFHVIAFLISSPRSATSGRSPEARYRR